MIKKSSVANFFFFLYQFTGLFSLLINQFRILSTIIGIFCLILTMLFSQRKGNYFLILSIIYLIGIMSGVYTGNYRINEIAMIAQYAGVGFILLEYRINYRWAKITFYFAAIFFIAAFVGGIPYNIFNNFSDNYASIYMINYCVIVYISMRKNGIKDSIIPALVTFIVCFISTGRAAIICGCILFGLYYIYFLWNKKKIENKQILMRTILSVVVCFIAIFALYDSIIYPLLANFYSTHKLDTGFKSIGRMQLLENYVINIKESWGNFLFGVPCRNNNLFLAFGSNWHNSYLRMHCFFGIIGLFLFLVISMKTIVRSFKNTKWITVFLITILIRMLTDSAAVNSAFDPILYYMLLYDIFEKVDIRDNAILDTYE